MVLSESQAMALYISSLFLLNGFLLGLRDFNKELHLVTKAGSVISSKSPSRAFRQSGIYYRVHRSSLTSYALKKIADYENVRDNECCLRSFSVNYGSVS